jgi:hypothetical protein
MKRGFEGVVVPSKVLGYLARGAPVLYIGPGGDVSRLLADSGGGIWYENGDVSGVAGSMRLLGTSPDVLAQRGQDGADFYWRNLSRDAALRKYAALAADCLAIGVAGE